MQIANCKFQIAESLLEEVQYAISGTARRVVVQFAISSFHDRSPASCASSC
jgi:hypothetical protein